MNLMRDVLVSAKNNESLHTKLYPLLVDEMIKEEMRRKSAESDCARLQYRCDRMQLFMEALAGAGAAVFGMVWSGGSPMLMLWGFVGYVLLEEARRSWSQLLLIVHTFSGGGRWLHVMRLVLSTPLGRGRMLFLLVSLVALGYRWLSGY